MNDENYMRIALELAKKGMGYVNPNPMVGAVIVKNGRIIGKGYHQKYGELHAERMAFADCTENCDGATIYVTLEPCCHYGKTPPCTDAIIEHKISRVVIGSSDPNPLVSGKGVKILRDNGIEVVEGVLKNECDDINEIFIHYITTKRPFVTMKYAMTADGKIASYTGDSKWITCEKTREYSHIDRLKHSAIMIGYGTAAADNPQLTYRGEGGRNPIRIVCDSNLNISVDSNIVQSADKIPTILAACHSNSEKEEILKKHGCRIIMTEPDNGRVDLCELMSIIGRENIDSVLLEGGGELNWAALKSGIVSKVKIYMAPKIFGGAGAKTPVSGTGISSPDNAFLLKDTKISRIYDDILIEGRVVNVHGNN